ncbi:MAG: helix-turn-helix transcriptional regulator [Bacteroidaceae bacterium]|nr:helix-turn-helix transcriptional regulator [Bacteroidaceae bacterium]
MLFGKKIRELREEKGLLQRQVAASLEMDSCLYSKIERGERKARREQVESFAVFFKVPLDELLTLWLADQLNDTLSEENSSVAKDAVDTYLRYCKE